MRVRLKPSKTTPLHHPRSMSHLTRLFALLAVTSTSILMAGCSATGALNAVTSNSSYTLNADVAYGTQPRQKLDIYTPKTAPPAAGWPVVVFFYGGSWNSGIRTQYQFVGEALAARGVVTLVADYRLYPEVRYPDFLSDSAQALAYGLDHAAQLGGDPKRVFVMGHSAGGYNAAMLALDARWLTVAGHNPRELAGWIGLAGPLRFLSDQQPGCQARVLPPQLSTELAAHRVHLICRAAQLSRGSGGRQVGQPAAQHSAVGRKAASCGGASYAKALPPRQPHHADWRFCLADALDSAGAG